MKKAIYTLALLAMVTLSCSSNDDSTPPEMEVPEEMETPETPQEPETPEEPEMPETPEEPETPEAPDTTLPVSVKIVDSDGNTETITYTYDGMRLVKETSSDGFSTEYLYTNGQLTGSLNKAPSFGNISESFEYDAEGRVNRVIINIPNASQNIFVLTYSNNNNTVTGTAEGKDIGPDSDVFTFSNNNILTFKEGDRNFTTYTYDTNNAPFKNVANRELLVRLDSENINALNFTTNNLVTEVMRGDLRFENPDTTTYNYNYTFTASNYPRVVTENVDGEITTYTYTYNND
jgi:hypothetical protein